MSERTIDNPTAEQRAEGARNWERAVREEYAALARAQIAHDSDAPAELPDELEPMRHTLDELSADALDDPDTWAEPSAEIKARARREMKAMQRRLAQLDEALGS
jgi:hypothetical protein